MARGAVNVCKVMCECVCKWMNTYSVNMWSDEMRTIDPNPSNLNFFASDLSAWRSRFVQFTFRCGARMTRRSKVLVDADGFLCRQQFCRERNILTNIRDSIARCRNQLQLSKCKFNKLCKNWEIICKRTFPPWVKMCPPPLISCPLIAVTPPAIAFTAWKIVFNIDFFNCQPSNGMSFSWKFKSITS